MSPSANRIAALAALAAASALALGLLPGCGGDDSDGSSGSLGGVAEAEERYKGLFQNGTQLGDPKAKQGVVVFVDLQSPESAAFFAEQLPGIIDRHVRNGEVVLQLRVIARLGPDSRAAQQWAVGAQLQNLVWQFSDIFFANQGEPDSGYVTESFLTEVAEAAGVDVEQAEERFETDLQRTARADNQVTARLIGVESVPDFFLYAVGVDKPVRIVPEAATVDAFSEALEAARQGG